MRSLSAAFFSWVQGARFYIDTHAEAVALVPSGEGKTWLDVGCGPGLVARLASRRGYRATGIDRSPKMIERAIRLARGESSCRFEIADLEGLASKYSADVVSAASLLFVVQEPEAALVQLWSCVRPGGNLLVVETTEKMAPRAALQTMTHIRPGRRLALLLWARARNGRSVAPSVYDRLAPASGSRTPLLDGLVSAWVFKKT
ncbi:MAG: class I SAM-dependent methyltransferase [Alphaproteobacteria bacterium]|nr:class I SAM-dependent methyltransferase [Alphaproteobacteria bacterium]